MSGDFSLLSLAREHTDNDRTHWQGCERLHRECLIQRMADEIERLNKLIATAAETGDIYEAKLSAVEAQLAEEQALRVAAESGCDEMDKLYRDAQARVAELERENEFMRALTGNSDKACVYCGLGADEQGKCERGFPGCARADDQLLCREVGVAIDRDQWKARAEVAESAIGAHNASCAEACGLGDQEGVRCGYRPYFPRHCPDCPRDWMIDIERVKP